MHIEKTAAAGTLESSDCLVTVEPSASEIKLEIESVVLSQYGEEIRGTVLETLKSLHVQAASVHVQDKGALNCVIAARVEAAELRAQGEGGQE